MLLAAVLVGAAWAACPCPCTGPHTRWHHCEFELPLPTTPACGCAGAGVRVVAGAPLRHVLLWQGLRDDLGYVYRNEAVAKCARPCRFLVDRAALSTADAVLFSLIYLEPSHLPDAKAHASQAWIAHCAESPANFFGRNLRRPIMERFDLHVTVSDAAHVRFNYLTFDLFAEHTFARLVAPPPDVARKSGLVAWFATNCNAPNGRQTYVERLMQHVRVDSHGDCLRNMPADASAARHADDWQQRKIDVIGQYHFVLAFENSQVDNYVTEKFFHAFLAGTVPVFMGARNVHRFAPANDSYIDVADFATPEALAAHLTALAADPVRYLALHEWRRRPLAESFVALARESVNTVPCRVCEAVHEWHERRLEQRKSEL